MDARKKEKMKRFNLKGVWDGLSGFRQSMSLQPKPEIDCSVEETLRSEHFQVTKVNSSKLSNFTCR